MLRVLLITAQYINRSEAHDQYQIPAAGIVQNIASNFQMFDNRNAGSQGQHSSAELCDMFIADALLVLNQNVVLQHGEFLESCLVANFGACRDEGSRGIE